MIRVAARIFLGLLSLFSAVQAAHSEKRVALVIGNSNYKLGPLDNPKNDADDLTAALKRLQFDVTEHNDLNVLEFDEALEKFEEDAKGADAAFFFFSGHGVQIDKRGFLAPVDVKAESESSALRELESIQDVVAHIENAAKVSVIVLDACRDGLLQEHLRRIAVEKNRALDPPKGLPAVSVIGSNTLIVYATVPGETADDGKGRNSPFTASLLKNIETPGLEIEQMFKHVTADVLNATGGKQQPERLSRLQNELVLLPAKVEVKQAVPPLSEAAGAWAEIKDKKDAAVFEAFREQYGASNPLYDTLAAEKIGELSQPKLTAPAAATETRSREIEPAGILPHPARPRNLNRFSLRFWPRNALVYRGQTVTAKTPYGRLTCINRGRNVPRDCSLR
jgi:Caspase domain